MARQGRRLRSSTALFAAALAGLAPSAALAHTHLDHAVPAADAAVSGGPSELQLAFSETIVPSLSSVRLTTVGGAAVAAGKPAADAANPKLLHVRVDKPLAPGSYVVRWRVVATDTHPTAGTYTFTVK